MKNLSVLWYELWFKPSNHWFIQLFRYTFVGGLAFIVDFGTLTLIKEILHFHYLIAAALGFILGWLCNYFLSTMWVFYKKKFQNKTMEFLIFGLIGLVGLGFNQIFIYFFTDKVGLDYRVSKLTSTGIVYLWNFFARKFILFEPKTKREKTK